MTTNSDTGNARGVWAWWPLRFVVMFVTIATLYIGFVALTTSRARLLTGGTKELAFIGIGLMAATICVLVYRLLVWWTERRPVTELRAGRAVPLVLSGAVIGFVLFVAVYAIIWTMGAATMKGFGTTDRLAIVFGMSFAAAFGEEIVFRGVVFRLFEEGFGTTIAVVISGVVFGALHAANPGATLASSAAIALEAGILLAAAYALTRSLWLPIGLHFAWNFTEGGIFGAAVSGGSTKGLINAPLSGPVYLTGGAFGPEASIPAVGVCLVAAVVMLVMAAQSGKWKPMRFRLRGAGGS
jgi:membrane protease YdiL (CAAX protease family)